MKLKKIALLALVCLMAGSALQAAGRQAVDLAADVLEYDSTTGVIHAAGSVRMRQGDATLTGSRAEYNINSREGSVTGGVTLHKDDVRMTAAAVKTLDSAHIAAEGDVVVTKGGSTLTGPRADYYTDREYVVIDADARIAMPDGTMTADRLEAYLADNRLIATGSVRIASQTKNIDATSDKATYDGGERGKVVLSGNAVAVQDNNTLRGNTVTLYLGEGK